MESELLSQLKRSPPPELNGGEVTQVDKQMVIDDKTKQSTGEVLFDFIAKSVANFMSEQNITTKLPLGFTFSFPVKQHSLISGDLIRWTKDFSATGVVDHDVVQLLREAFIRRGVSTAWRVWYGFEEILPFLFHSVSRMWTSMW